MFAINSERFQVRAFSKYSLPPALANLSSRVFNDDTAKATLDASTYAAFKACQASGKPMEKAAANSLARGLMGWAQSKGCVSFAHWFSPMRGANGEKYDNFIDLNFAKGTPITDFSGSRLFMNETDGSSFPNGGLRKTHSAAAYMVCTEYAG